MIAQRFLVLLCLVLYACSDPREGPPEMAGSASGPYDGATPSAEAGLRSDAGAAPPRDGSATTSDAGGGADAGGQGQVGLDGSADAGDARGDGDDAGAPVDGDPDAAASADCKALVSDPKVNWRESALKTDQEIVACLSASLGRPVGYGEKARGGYLPGGGSKLTIVRKGQATSVEQQIADAVRGDEANWIVFDKADFKEPYEIGLYRLYCDEPSVQAALGITGPELCVDYRAWCTEHSVASADCLKVFFNDRLNDGDLPIRNVQVGSNKTLDGRQSEARFLFSGFVIGKDSEGKPVDTASSVILTNLWFAGAGHAEDHELDPDMIRSTGASHDIWIHQNTFDLTGDSAFDVKVGAYNVTVSFNLVRNVLRAALHGSSDSRTINEQITTTIHHNAFITTDALYTAFGNTARRVPLIRRGKSHLFNNVFYNYRKEILSVRVGARVLFEDNMFLANPDAAGDDDLDYYAEHLLSGYEEGGLEIKGTRVWWSAASCAVNPGDSRDLTASYGSTPNMSADYSAASRAILNAQRLPAGEKLADYVLGAAGKGGAAPFNSPYSPGSAAIMGMPHQACTQ